MVKKFIRFARDSYKRVIRSIAFYPVLIVVLFLIVGLLTLNVENHRYIQSLKEELPYLFIEDKQTARAILSTFIAGIISLTVFSFTMVMVVLNQASANYSPRLLPGLISNRTNQIILGSYIGTLFYCILVLMTLGAYEMDQEGLGLSSMIASLASLGCVALFVYFIHSISSGLQISNIIHAVVRKCETMDLEQQEPYSDDSGNLPFKHRIFADESGYFTGFDQELLSSDLAEIQAAVHVLPNLEDYIYEGACILRSDREFTEEHQAFLRNGLLLTPKRLDGVNIMSSMGKLTEIAVKALSPGINDPGTAIDVLAALFPLLEHALMHYPLTTRQHGELEILQNHVKGSKVLAQVIQPIRHYGREDAAVLCKLGEVLTQFRLNDSISEENRQAVEAEIQAISDQLEKSNLHLMDIERIRALLSH